MALISITTDVTVRQALGSGDILYVKQGASIIATGGSGISAETLTESFTRLRIDGAVFSADTGISLMATDAGFVTTGVGKHSVTIGATGSVIGGGTEGLDLRGTGNTVVNFGSISALSDQGGGIRQGGDGVSIQNFGSIDSGFGIYLYGNGGSSDIMNAGTISGLTSAILLERQSINLINSGLITAASGSGRADAITISYGSFSASYITNTGQIIGDISGPLDQAIDIINAGIIIGRIDMSDGSDLYDGRGGTLIGTVAGGDGDDIYIIDDATTDIFEELGKGYDTVKSTVSYALGDNLEILDLLGMVDINGTGNSLDNIINGNSGNNVLRGAEGQDDISGGKGDDTLRGGTGNDLLKGASGDDVLRGGAGNDTLRGGGGDDVLIGGAGRDRLFGQSGSDVFRFNKVTHSPDNARNDQIRDFTQGEDIIDLTGLVAGNLDFIGGSGFSGVGQAEVRVTASGGNALVRVDVDGDGVADMRILVTGLTSLNDLDFLL